VIVLALLRACDLTGVEFFTYVSSDGSPLGIKRERGAGEMKALRRGCPRNCKRRIFRHMSTGISGPGKATAG